MISPFMMPNSVTVERQTSPPVSDAVGGPRANYAVVTGLAGLAASIQHRVPQQVRYDYSQRKLTVDTVIYLLGGVVIRDTDRLSDDATGLKYLVRGFGDETGRGVLLPVYCEQVL